MSLFVDTSVWSLALRRDAPPSVPEVDRLTHAIDAGELVFTTGLVLQELLQGFHGPKVGQALLRRFDTLPFAIPAREDHVEAATLRNHCRRHGVQIGTIDALLAQLCIHHDLVMLTADHDFSRIAGLTSLRVWTS